MNWQTAIDDSKLNLIDATIERAFAEHRDRVLRVQRLREALRCAEAAAARFPGCAVSKWMGYKGTVQIEVSVAGFREVLPILEFVESWRVVGEEPFVFKDSSDFPSIMQRDYHSWGVSVSARLRADAEGCRRVVRRFETTPVYAFECEEAA